MTEAPIEVVDDPDNRQAAIVAAAGVAIEYDDLVNAGVDTDSEVAQALEARKNGLFEALDEADRTIALYVADREIRTRKIEARYAAENDTNDTQEQEEQ